jgi:hypothetical protein
MRELPGSRRTLVLEIERQPTDTTCGPTCLHAVYRYYGEPIDLGRVVAEVVPLSTGGTLAVHLGNHAIARGYRATIYSCNLQLFDPTWFLGGEDLGARLRSQAEVKEDAKLREATAAHLSFLESGGTVAFGEITPEKLYAYLARGVPLLTGLSATYLYGHSRERFDKPDSVEGHPVGHFVVLCGAEPERARVLVADPLEHEPHNRSHLYWVDTDRLIASILLGVLTYDASVLVLEPPDRLSDDRPGDTGVDDAKTDRH